MSILTTKLAKLALNKQIAKPLFWINYHWVKTLWVYHYHYSKLRGKEPLVVYQMGKVGSSTVVASLKSISSKWTVYHIHTLTREGIEGREKIYRKMVENSSTTYFPRAKHLLASRYLHRSLTKGLNGKKWKIVTLVRDPIARQMSEFFQTIDYWLPDFNQKYQANTVNIETAVNTFLDKRQHNQSSDWFETDLKPSLGIDVFGSDFPKSKGYKIYSGQQVELLVLKLETLNKCATDAFAEFLKIDNFHLINTNVGSEKMYAAAYKKFRTLIDLPETYINNVYTSRYMRHFYDEAEIEKFKSKWSSNHEV